MAPTMVGDVGQYHGTANHMQTELQQVCQEALTGVLSLHLLPA